MGRGKALVNVKDITDSPLLHPERMDLVDFDISSKSGAAYLAKEGDIFFVRSSVKRDGVGAVGMLKNNETPVIHCGFVIRFRLESNQILPRFAFYLFNTSFNREKVRNISGGATIVNISQGSLKMLKFKFPPLHTQRKIANILSAYDDLIENNLKRIKLLEEKAQLTYEEWFMRMKFPGYETTTINKETGLPEGWKKEKFDKNFTLSNGYAFKSSDYQTSGVKILRTKDYSQTKWVNIDQPIFLSNEKADKYQKYYVRPYDLMLIMVGASIGNYGIILPRDTGILQNQNQWAIRAKNEHLNFFKILMMEDLIQKLLGKKTGAARDFFRASFLKEIELNMPSELTLIQFNNNIKPLYESINNLFIQIDNLKEGRDILLPRLMTGMIDVEQMNLETLQPTKA